MMTNYSRKSLYIGVTNNLFRRVCEHKQGLREGFTKQYKITQLIYYEVYDYVWEALKREKYLKHWPRKRKEALIAQTNPYWQDLASHIDPGPREGALTLDKSREELLSQG